MTSSLDKYNVNIDKRILNNFIHESNYKQDIVIAPANTSIIPVYSDNSNTVKAIDSSVSFNASLTPGLLYSNYMEIGSTVHVHANNVKVHEDIYMTAASVQHRKANHTVVSPDFVYYFKDNASATAAKGLASEADIKNAGGVDVSTNLLQSGNNMRGLSANPLNSIEHNVQPSFLNCVYASQVVVGSNNSHISTPGGNSVRFNDVMCRTLPENVSKTQWCGLMYPNKNIIKNQRVLAFEKSHPIMIHIGEFDGKPLAGILGGWDWSNAPNGAPSTDYKNHAKIVGAAKRYTNDTACATYKDIENDANCSHSVRMGNEHNVSFTFTKALPSVNFNVSINPIPESAGTDQLQTLRVKVDPTADATTSLNTYVIDGHTFPSSYNRIHGWTDLQMYELLGDKLFFRYNQTNANIVAHTMVTTGELKDKVIYFIHNTEPSGQSLSIKKTIRLRHPMYNQLLTINPLLAQCFSNCFQFKATLTKSNDLLSCFTYIGAVPYTVNGTGDLPRINVNVENTTLYMLQYGLNDLESAVQPISVLNYSTFVNKELSNNVVIDTTKKYTRTTINMPLVHIGSDLFQSSLFYVDGGKDVNLEGCIIRQISAVINNGNNSNSLSDRDELILYQHSLEGGLVNYKCEDIYGSYNRNYRLSNDASSYGTGSIVMLSLSQYGFGSESIVSSLTSKTSSISFILTVDVPSSHLKKGEPTVSVRANIYFTNSARMHINQSNAVLLGNIIEYETVVDAIDSVRELSKSKALTTNTRIYHGGFGFNSLFRVLHSVPKIINGVKSVGNKIGSVVNTASNVMDGVNTGLKTANKIFYNR